MDLEVNGIRYPLVYNAFSTLVGKPYCVVVVRKPGEFYQYEALDKKKPSTAWSDYNEQAAHSYDNPQSGIFFVKCFRM